MWLQLYSFVNMLHICSRTPFLRNTSGELLLYIVLNIEVIHLEVLFKRVNNCLKYISILLTLFLTLYVTFAWWVKVSFQKPPMVVDKRRKRGYIYVFIIWIPILSFTHIRPLNFAQDVICPWLLGISERSIISPWYSKGWHNITCRTTLTISQRNYENI